MCCAGGEWVIADSLGYVVLPSSDSQFLPLTTLWISIQEQAEQANCQNVE